jgi:hypothetical protein
MLESRTERARYAFVVKEFERGTPWLALEAIDKVLPVLSKGFIGFDLRPGTTVNEAKRFADLLNDTITTTSYTT